MTTSTKIKLYTSVAAIDKATTAFKAAGLSLQGEAHKLACSVLVIFGKHKDVRVVDAFIKAMPDMARVNALKDWFTAFGPVSFGEDGKSVSYVTGKPVELAKAMDEPFWKFSPEAAYKPVDVAAMLASLEKKLATDATKTGRDHTAVINALKAIVPVEAVKTPTAEVDALLSRIDAKKLAKV